ncbi:MAG: leucyl aminopeptidase [Bacteroidia bacterium]|nr:leucyl aminopeptidase [Bacteroidia bacterium]
MTKITLNNKIKTQSHVLLITEKFNNEFELPEKVNDYIVNALNDKDKKTLSYNYIGKYISIIIVDKSKEETQLNEQLRRHGATVADAINAHKGKEIYIYNQTNAPHLSLAAAEGIALANYQFIKHKPSAAKQKNTLESIIIANTKIDTEKISELNIVVDATLKARDLVNEPVNVLNATALANSFKHMGKEAGFDVEIYNKKKIQQLKMGGILAVNAGSVDEPTFTIMEYKPKGAVNKHPYVLVGKGVVYDTGGLSLKPTPNSMDLMKCDMAGAAAVGCAMYAIAKAKLKVHVVALVPATDNRPGFNAFAPGDVITMMDGSTVEMLNSDAEGRMILADALHFAKKYKPELVIDMATLTGAAAAAIGTFGMVGMGTADKKQKEKIIQSGLNVHERIAEFPFWDDYSDLMKSDIADQKNIGGPAAGSITAGKFLQKFTDYPYYHLDIAGPAFLSAKDNYKTKGGTGYGVRFFFELMKNV